MDRRQATGRFTRTIHGPVIEIERVHLDKDTFPPAKIGDLEVKYKDDEKELIEVGLDRFRILALGRQESMQILDRGAVVLLLVEQV